MAQTAVSAIALATFAKTVASSVTIVVTVFIALLHGPVRTVASAHLQSVAVNILLLPLKLTSPPAAAHTVHRVGVGVSAQNAAEMQAFPLAMAQNHLHVAQAI